MGCSHAANIVEPSRAAQASKNKQQTTAATVATDVVRSATTTLTAKPEAKPVLLGQFCDTGSKLLDVQAGKEVESLGFVFTNVPKLDPSHGYSVVVTDVVPGSWADKVGFRIGDILEEMNGKTANEMSGMRIIALKKAAKQRPIHLKLRRFTKSSPSLDMTPSA